MSSSSTPIQWGVYAIDHTIYPYPYDDRLIGQFQTCADAIASIPDARHYLCPNDNTDYPTRPISRPVYLVRNNIPLHLRGPDNSIIIGRSQCLDEDDIYRIMQESTLPCIYLYEYANRRETPALVTYVWHHPFPFELNLHVNLIQTYRVHADEHMVRLDAHNDIVCKIQSESYYLGLRPHTRYEPSITLPYTTHAAFIDAINQYIQKRTWLSSHEKISMMRDLAALNFPNVRDVIRPSYILN